MLLSNRLLSKHNDCLTVDTIKWVLKNALNISPNTLYQMKVAQNADHPLMREESLYDELPVDVQALFVMEPYFPRKHFDRAFAWLFGKESIAQINADDFSHYTQLAKKNSCYTSMDSWEDLQLTSEELSHLFNEFRQLPKVSGFSQLTACMMGLIQNASITPEIYEQALSSGTSLPNYNVCTEVANRHIDRCMGAIRAKRQINAFDVIDMSKHLRLENISRDRRDALLAELDMTHVGFAVVSIIYNDNIPDDVFRSCIENKIFNAQQAEGLLSDVRFPKEDATRIAFSKPQKYANYYLARGDLDNDIRAKFISTLTRENLSKPQLKQFFSELVYDRVITKPEFELAKFSIGNISAPYCISEFYDDVELFVEAVECSYKNKKHPNKDAMENLKSIELSSILYSPHWTKDSLLQLLKITREWPADLNNLESQKMLRQNILRKLFCESVYPSLDKENLMGPYGRAENLLARLLDSDAHLLEDFDINLIARSRIQLDYSDDEVNLAIGLANNPDINERIVAERLRLQLEQISDTPTLTRQRRAL